MRPCRGNHFEVRNTRLFFPTACGQFSSHPNALRTMLASPPLLLFSDDKKGSVREGEGELGWEKEEDKECDIFSTPSWFLQH